MINSVNSLEFLKSKLLTMDKYSSTANTKVRPPSYTQARKFDSLQEKFLLSNEIKNQDRVRVQHLENHTNLQNNKCCNTFRTLYDNTSASSNVRDKKELQTHQVKEDPEIDVLNVEHLNSTIKTPLNIQNKSAFNIDFNNKCQVNNKIAENNNAIDNIKINSSISDETKKFWCKESNCHDLNKKSDRTKIVIMAKETQINATDSQRTEDQNNAYRHIESVHNYAKSKSFEDDDYDKTSPNGSRHSSFLSEDDEEEDEDNGDAEYDNDGNIDYEDRLPDDLDADYEDIFNKRRYRRFQKLSPPTEDTSLNNSKLIDKREIAEELQKSASCVNTVKGIKIQNTIKLNNVTNESNCEDEEDQIDVDVESVEPQLSPNSSLLDANSLLANGCIREESAAFVKPDHHARRPMNAFLIFCKRHRAIVKDRYKNLENRAITKILGDWWASLDSNEKKCFNNLAQQNKDAFFSANPNFKWYKLPAPPLRTLTTRPANTFGQEFQDDNSTNGLDVASNVNSYNQNHTNYFKLANEAHMGDLSQLMQDKSKTIKQCADLQQALSETSQFMSTHITCSSEISDETHLKRRFYNENSFSSNSSEEDSMEPKKKSARSCKGKRYQEFINSGQISTALKKPKSLVRAIGGDTVTNFETNIKPNSLNVCNLSNLINNDYQKRSLSESESMISYDANTFDLEEKIKELPALNLDDYLQRKRNTKKKKKFSSNGKKRGQRKNNQTPTSLLQNKDRDFFGERLDHQMQLTKYHQQPSSTAVGSQKRKARKESITRRDVSVIEQEVASLLPLTINGCCYFQEAPSTAIEFKRNGENDFKACNITSQSPFLTPTSPIIPNQENSLSPVSIEVFNNTNACKKNTSKDNISSSTSDLLILAEVAANRTELKD